MQIVIGYQNAIENNRYSKLEYNIRFKLFSIERIFQLTI